MGKMGRFAEVHIAGVFQTAGKSRGTNGETWGVPVAVNSLRLRYLPAKWR